MDSYIIHETAQEIIDLLQRVDDGYILTEDERQNLKQITVADFSELGLKKLPESIGVLSPLTQLDVSRNQLTSLPKSIGDLSQLTQLNAFNNQLTSLPESIGSLSRLTTLDISDNQLTSLPENIGSLSRLTTLDISGNQLTSLPESIGSLPQLTQLIVYDNQLTSLPESIGSLSRLTTLDISGNQLTNLPESIGSLSQLTQLSVSKNQLIALPESIGDLFQLTKLNISSNKLSNLPESIGNLSQLVLLDLCKLRLQEVPHGVRQLSKLKFLDLRANPLKILPDWLGDMSQLDFLDISSLQLTALPRSLLKLDIPFFANKNMVYFNILILEPKKFTGIFTDHTELSIQPISLFDQSRDKSPEFRESRKLIEEYFRAKKVPVREAKVIFLGDGRVGKTYTIQRLLNGCRKGDYPTKETHGILIENFHTEKNGETYTIRIWDFGGQDIMHEMHRCFLTDRTCYVIMVDTRLNNQTIRARHWLRTVQSIAPKSPVLLLINQISGNKNLNLDYNKLKQEFPNLVNAEYCSSMDASDEEFRQKVEQTIFQQVLNMDSCKMEFPENWESIRQNLLSLQEGTGTEQQKTYYIDRQTFHDLCDRYAVPADNGLRAWLLIWFNDLGVCFSYHLGENGQERSLDYKILNPMWLTSAVYKIIWEKEQTDDGLIARSEIYRILEEPGSAAMKKDGIPCLENVSYSKQECGYVLDIMRMFCISYSVNDSIEFIPALCNPNSKLDIIPKHWKQHIAYQFRYTFLPENVLHRLMIYCFNNLRLDKCWRKGFWLEHRDWGLSAVIRAEVEGSNSEENTLQIDVYAQEDEYEVSLLLAPLCKQIAKINNSLLLQAEDFVLAENDDEEKWFSLDRIWYWKNRGMLELQGEKSYFPIQPLLVLIYGRLLWSEEKKRVKKQDDFQKISVTLSQTITEKDEEQAGLDLSIPFQEQLIEELKRNNALREREMNIREENTHAIEENTAAVWENTWTLQQSNALLCAIRDGKVEIPSNVMDALTEALRQSDQPALQDAEQKMRGRSPKEKLQLFRGFLGDAANIVTLKPVLFEIGKKLGPTLIKILATRSIL